MAVVLGNDLHPSFVSFLQGMNTPMGILLPVLGVLSITSEWSQRTAMVTFTLEPSRMRVVAGEDGQPADRGGARLGRRDGPRALANVLYGAFSGNPSSGGASASSCSSTC